MNDNPALLLLYDRLRRLQHLPQISVRLDRIVVIRDPNRVLRDKVERAGALIGQDKGDIILYIRCRIVAAADDDHIVQRIVDFDNLF